MPRNRSGATAVAMVVVSAALGVVTNLITQKWTWALGVGLAALVVAAAVLAWSDRSRRAAEERPATTYREHVGGESRLHGGTGEARNGARISVTATNNSEIIDSSTTARGDVDVDRRADGRSSIRNRNVVAGEDIRPEDR